jgi:hypothetical protein
MSIRFKWTVLSAIGLSLFIFVSFAQAQQPYEITCCGAGTVTLLYASKDLTILSADLKGISRSNHPNKTFNNCTWHLVGLLRIENGKTHWYQYRKYQDPDGDTFAAELSGVDNEGTFKFLKGTGKWSGITGGGKAWLTARGKPIMPGTSQYCGISKGTYELKK